MGDEAISGVFELEGVDEPVVEVEVTGGGGVGVAVDERTGLDLGLDAAQVDQDRSVVAVARGRPDGRVGAWRTATDSRSPLPPALPRAIHTGRRGTCV
ncbi:hypothetical protein [Nocardia farcinica]|uniref:hypothetical protein n=1 Tax=Nocardia farcinica TaxID=37329 RepID=UPI00189490C1|nr:hypothetical protein [Nocardia farcinica]MBF6271700.1 hypothetical protein [Nocardia farcinica]